MSGGFLSPSSTFFHPPVGPEHLIKMTSFEETDANTVIKGETFEFPPTDAKQILLTSTKSIENHPLATERTTDQVDTPLSQRLNLE